MNMKKLAIWLTAIMGVSFILAAIMATTTGSYIGLGAFRTSNNFSFNFNLKGTTYTVDEREVIQADGINKLNVYTVSTDVHFIESDENEIVAHLHGKISTNNQGAVPQLYFKSSSDSLDIEAKRRATSNTSIYNSTLRLDVYLPKAEFERITVNTVSGDLFFNELKVVNFNYKSVSGDLDGNTLIAKDVELNTTSGDFDISSVSGNLYFKSVSGDFDANFNNDIHNKIEIKTTSGDINMTNVKGDIKATSVSGDFLIRYNQFQDNKISISSTSGNVNVTLPDTSEFYLKTSTTSGKISCSFPIAIQGSNSARRLEGNVGNSKGDISISTTSGNIKVSK